MSHREFTDDEMMTLLSNRYTAKVTPDTLTHTLEFKQLFMKEYEAGTRIVDIYRNAGYDIEMLGRSRINHKSQKIRKEAASPDGLKPVRNVREEQIAAFASRDLEKEEEVKAIKELQREITLLEQEVEFLKKILFLRK